jgi:dethiobiotin synthetase
VKRRSPVLSHKICFVTGTDTGVGKTVLSALLLHHLRSEGVHALAIKPFCAGGLADVQALARVQENELSAAEISPFQYAEPLAPVVASRRDRRAIRLNQVVAHIHSVAGRCECLIVEGCGGVKVPLGTGFFVDDLAAALRCAVLVVARNQLGTINHSILTVEALQRLPLRSVKLVLMDTCHPDYSAATNCDVLRRLLRPLEVIRMKFFNRNPLVLSNVKTICRNTKKTLARIIDSVSL